MAGLDYLNGYPGTLIPISRRKMQRQSCVWARLPARGFLPGAVGIITTRP
jgi:hypothetical protein